MTSRQPKKPSLNDLKRKLPDHGKQLEILLNLVDKDDNSAILLATCYLENALTHAISDHFRDFGDKRTAELALLFDDSSDGPVSTLSAKTRLGYALGVLGPIARNDFNLIRQIRNAFAHPTQHLDFDTPEISETCQKLQGPDGEEMAATIKAFRHKQAKIRFLVVVSQYHWFLQIYSHKTVLGTAGMKLS
jgi:DNA-binding MltR family transcriptional regulator